MFETLSSDFSEFPIMKSQSITYFVDVLGRPIGEVPGSLLVWYSQDTKSISIVFEIEDQACLLSSGTLTQTYR